MIGQIIAFTPAVGYAWPALLPAALLAAAKLGYSACEDPNRAGIPILNKLKRKLVNSQVVSIDLMEALSAEDKPLNVELMEEEFVSDQQMQWTRGEITVIFRKDPRGKFMIDVMGPAKASRKELREAGLEFAREVAQGFAVNRVVEELEKTNANVVEESREANGDVVLKLRRWV